MSRKFGTLLRYCFFVTLLIFLAYSFIKIPIVTHGFTGYYTFSRMLLKGEDLGKSYDSSYFNVKIKEYGINGVYDVQPNIPTNSFAYLPVAWLNPLTAKIVWGTLSIAFLLVSILLLLHVYEISIRDNAGTLALILALIWRPVYLNLALGQIYLFLLFLFSIS